MSGETGGEERARRWIVLAYRLPPESRARVAIWREARRRGALLLQQAVLVLPDDHRFVPALEALRARIAEVGGEATVLQGSGYTGADHAGLVVAWNAARDDEYRELIAECGKFLEEIAHEFTIEKFTPAELEEEEAELDKLERWLARIVERDVHGALEGRAATAAVGRARQELERYAQAVYERVMEA